MVACFSHTLGDFPTFESCIPEWFTNTCTHAYTNEICTYNNEIFCYVDNLSDSNLRATVGNV